MQLTADLTHLPLSTRQNVLRQLADDDAAQLAIAKVNQAKAARLYRDAVGPGTAKEGIGPVSLVMDPYFVSYFRRLHGERIFEDPEFVEFLKRRGEWFHVPETGTRVQVGYVGAPRTKFHKSYA